MLLTTTCIAVTVPARGQLHHLIYVGARLSSHAEPTPLGLTPGDAVQVS